MSLRMLPWAVLMMLVTAGCQAGGVRVPINSEQARQLKLQPNGGIAADSEGLVYLTTAANLTRYDPRTHQVTDLLLADESGLRDVALTADGVVLVLQSDELSAYVSGYLLKVVSLPTQAQALSCDRGFAYVQARAADGSTRLLRYDLQQHTLETLAVLDDPLSAICAVRGGCLIACGGKVFKVTDPKAASAGGGGGGRESAVVLLFAIRGPITALAADADHKIVYCADKDMTYAWVEGKVVPLFPCGGRLAWSRDVLTICRPESGQVVQVGGAAGEVERVRAALAKAGQKP
jgi:hypothetical protein